MTRPLLALDIETMPVVDDPDFNAPSHWRVLAIALGSVSPRTEQQTTVLLRRSDSKTAEAMLIDRAIMWLQARNASTLVTYNGSTFDLPILRHRAQATMPSVRFDTSVSKRLNSMLDAATHRDLFRELRRRRGENAPWLSLEDACYEYDIEITSARYEREIVNGSDVPRLGAKILDVATDSADEERVLREYASEDVRPLIQLAQKIESEGSA